MKPSTANPHYRVLCLRIEPALAGADTIRITSFPRDLVMDTAETYLSGTGFQMSGYAATANLAPGLVDLEGLADIAGLDRDAIATGFFDNARAYLFATDYTDAVEDDEPITASILGKATLADDRYQIQEFALVDVLSQTVNKTYTPSCNKAFGGTEHGGCKVDLASVTVTGTVTSVADRTTFTDSTRAEASDYFAAGTVVFTTGDNTGLAPYAVKSFASGVVTTYDAFPNAIQVGDAYTLVPGCRKRLEDCRDKWANVERFGGFTFVPVQTKYSEIGTK